MEKTAYEKKPFYPNVREAETVIWDRFLLAYPDAYDQVAYNVKVGEGMETTPDMPANIQKSGLELGQHKIDVVGFKGSTIDIIELKKYAGTSAVGQVIGYRDLFLHHIDANARPNLVIVTDTLRADTKLICEKQNIKLIVV